MGSISDGLVCGACPLNQDPQGAVSYGRAFADLDRIIRHPLVSLDVNKFTLNQCGPFGSQPYADELWQQVEAMPLSSPPLTLCFRFEWQSPLYNRDKKTWGLDKQLL